MSVKSAGVQVGYDGFNLRANYAKTSRDGKLDLDIRGPAAGSTFAFRGASDRPSAQAGATACAER